MRRTICGLLAVALAVAACGEDDSDSDGEPVNPDIGSSTVPPDGDEAVTGGVVAVPARQVSSADPSLAGAAVSALGADLFAASAPDDRNMVLSPLSIAVALAMLEPGASGGAIEQFHDLLSVDDPSAWHASMNALAADLEARVPDDTNTAAPPGEEAEPGEVEVTIANAAFLQPGYPFRADYLDVVGTNYGAALEELDFATDQEAAAARINDFVAAATDDQITDLVAPDAIDPATVLALVNALHLRASWQQTFDADATADRDFTLLDGGTVTVPLMSGRSDRSGRGDGWVAASKALVGDLRLDLVLPDEGRFSDVAARVGDVFAEVDGMSNPGGALGIPRFETRVDVPLTDVLRAAGLTAPFATGNLLGVADDPRLVIDQALHQSWIAVDEDGIEAAAATVLLMVATSAPIDEPIPVVVDRPFLFRVVDTVSGATLFLGQITDPE